MDVEVAVFFLCISLGLISFFAGWHLMDWALDRREERAPVWSVLQEGMLAGDRSFVEAYYAKWRYVLSRRQQAEVLRWLTEDLASRGAVLSTVWERKSPSAWVVTDTPTPIDGGGERGAADRNTPTK